MFKLLKNISEPVFIIVFRDQGAPKPLRDLTFKSYDKYKAWDHPSTSPLLIRCDDVIRQLANGL